jgi:iron complex outermembrane receptor protein
MQKNMKIIPDGKITLGRGAFEFQVLRPKRRRTTSAWANLIAGLLALAWVLACTGAWADETGATATNEPVAMEEITVTANKMEEDLIRVPQSITVIDEMILEEKGIKNVTDLIREIPNMVASSGPVATAVSFRGLNTSIFTNNNPVVIYIDGIAHTGREGFDASLANVERVEVLRGPQGTIYGKDAIGAVINIVTKKPENDWRGKIGAEYGSYNFARGVFNANGALVDDKLYVGINGQYQQDDGWIENENPDRDSDFNKADDRRVNLNLTATPVDRFTARISLINEYTREYGVNGFGLPGGASIGDFSRDDAEHLDMDAPTKQTTENNAQSLALTYDFGSVSLNAVTTHKFLEFDGEYDSDFGNVPFYAGLLQFMVFDEESWSQELRLASTNKDGFRWVTGLYYENERRDQPRLGQQSPVFDQVSQDYLGNFEMNAESRTDAETWAVFGQVVIPFVERFELTLGGRYQRIEKEIDLSMYYLPVGVSGPAMFHMEADKTWYAFLPKAALSWRFTGAWSTYVSYSRGYMPGGFNYFAMEGSAEDNRFKPQVSSNYEWGLKGVFERGSVAATVFYMDIEDIHIYKIVDMGATYVTDNARKAHSRGVELEVTYRPLDGLELTAAVGFIDAEYDDYDTGVGDFDGRDIELTPAHTIRAGAAYIHPSGFYGRVDIYNQGKQYFYDNATMDFPEQGAYTLVDARLGYRLDDWDFFVYGRNLTDEDYVSMYSSMRVISFGEPRTLGVGATCHF